MLKLAVLDLGIKNMTWIQFLIGLLPINCHCGKTQIKFGTFYPSIWVEETPMTSSSFNVLNGFKVFPIVFLLRALLLLHFEFAFCGKSLCIHVFLQKAYALCLCFSFHFLCSLVTFVFCVNIIALCTFSICIICITFHILVVCILMAYFQFLVVCCLICVMCIFLFIYGVLLHQGEILMVYFYFWWPVVTFLLCVVYILFIFLVV